MHEGLYSGFPNDDEREWARKLTEGIRMFIIIMIIGFFAILMSISTPLIYLRDAAEQDKQLFLIRVIGLIIIGILIYFMLSMFGYAEPAAKP